MTGTFHDRLNDRLHGSGIYALSSMFGRDGDRRVWLIPVRVTPGLYCTAQVDVEDGKDIYEEATCDHVARRLKRHFFPTAEERLEAENERLRGLVEQLWKAASDAFEKNEYYMCEWCGTATSDPWALGWKIHARNRVEGVPYKHWCCAGCGKPDAEAEVKW